MVVRVGMPPTTPGLVVDQSTARLEERMPDQFCALPCVPQQKRRQKQMNDLVGFITPRLSLSGSKCSSSSGPSSSCSSRLSNSKAAYNARKYSQARRKAYDRRSIFRIEVAKSKVYVRFSLSGVLTLLDMIQSDLNSGFKLLVLSARWRPRTGGTRPLRRSDPRMPAAQALRSYFRCHQR